MKPNPPNGTIHSSRDKLISGLVLFARLLLVYVCLFIYNFIVDCLDLTLIVARSISLEMLLWRASFEAFALFLFVALPILYAIKGRAGFLFFFLFPLSGMAVYNAFKVKMLQLSGATLVRHGFTLYNKGLITAWGLLEVILSLIIISLLIAACLKFSEQWAKD